MKICYLLATFVPALLAAKQAGYTKPSSYNSYNDNNYGDNDNDDDDDDTYSSGYKAPSSYGKPPSSYNQAPASYGGYKKAAPKSKVPAGQNEFKQFWNTLDYCDADFALVKCLLDCDVVQDFATTERAANCIKKFATNLCNKLAPNGCNTGRVSLTKQNCTNNAVVAAMYTVGQVQLTTIGGAESPVDLFLADNPDSFTLVKNIIAQQALVSYSDCIGSNLLNFADTCNAKKYFPEDTNQCVNNILKTCTNNDYAYFDNPEETNYLSKAAYPLSALLSGNTLYDDSVHGVNPHVVTDVHHASGLELLGNLIAGSEDVNFNWVQVNYGGGHNDAATAQFDVCPNLYTAINQRLNATVNWDEGTVMPTNNTFGITPALLSYDIPGMPLEDLAFHFPAQEYNSVKKQWEPKKYAAGGPNQFPAGTPYDPITPKGGIQDTCQQFYTISMFAWFAGQDTGDYCFSIDKYSVEFVESGVTEDLDWTHKTDVEDSEGGTCRNTDNYQTYLDAINGDLADLAAAGRNPGLLNTASTDLALDQAVWLSNNQPNECADCYTVSWKDPAYCPRHLARFRMHARCCLSFGNVMDQLCKSDSTRTRVPLGSYSAGYDVCPHNIDGLEYTALIYSDKEKGSLTNSVEKYNHLYNSKGLYNKIVHLWAIFNGAVLNLTPAQQAAFLAAFKFFGAGDLSGLLSFKLSYSTAAHAAWLKHHIDQVAKIEWASWYCDSNAWAVATSAFKNVQVAWNSIIALQPLNGTCYNPSCLLSRYIDCAEKPAKDETYHQHSRYVPAYQKDFRHYYLRVESTTFNWLALGSSGFAAGLVVVALAQVVMKRRVAADTANAVAYSQIM